MSDDEKEESVNLDLENKNVEEHEVDENESEEEEEEDGGEGDGGEGDEGGVSVGGESVVGGGDDVRAVKTVEVRWWSSKVVMSPPLSMRCH